MKKHLYCVYLIPKIFRSLVVEGYDLEEVDGSGVERVGGSDWYFW